VAVGAAAAQPPCDPPEQTLERELTVALGTATYTDGGTVVATRSAVLLSDPITAAAGNAILSEDLATDPAIDVASLTPFVDPDADNVQWIQGDPPPFPTSAEDRLLTRLRSVPFETTDEEVAGPTAVATFAREISRFDGVAEVNGTTCRVSNRAVVSVTVVAYTLEARRADGTTTTTPATTTPATTTPATTTPATTTPETTTPATTTPATTTPATTTTLPHLGDATQLASSAAGVVLLLAGISVVGLTRRSRPSADDAWLVASDPAALTSVDRSPVDEVGDDNTADEAGDGHTADDWLVAQARRRMADPGRQPGARRD
jgi:hypothetical protein